MTVIIIVTDNFATGKERERETATGKRKPLPPSTKTAGVDGGEGKGTEGVVVVGGEEKGTKGVEGEGNGGNSVCSCWLVAGARSLVRVNGGKGNAESGGELIDVLLRVMESGEFGMPITNENIKAIVFEMFMAGAETSSTTIIWVLSEMIKNPSVMAKAQLEVREALQGKKTFEDTDLEELKYLKLVIKETLRVHPAGPLLIPRECREETQIDGYNIPIKTKVIVNAWAIGRDPKCWDDPESFIPERFEDSPIDFRGNHFEFIPFGAGRRMCPGMISGLATVGHSLAKLLYHFDWKLPKGVNLDDFNMTEAEGVAASRKDDLCLIATSPENYIEYINEIL